MLALTRLAILAAGASVALALPQTNPVPNECTTLSKSGAFEWEIRDFQYNASWIFQNPAAQWASGTLNYTLVNPATGFEAECWARSSQLENFFHGTTLYTCSARNEVESSVPLPLPTFRFTAYGYWRLELNETWTCNQGFPDLYIGTGTKELRLNCQDTGTVLNPDWELGQPGNFYSTRYLNCDPLSTTLPAKITIAI